MANTYGKPRVHLVWSTRKRRPLIHLGWKQRLYDYIGGVVRNHDGMLFDAGGSEDHLHLYLEHSTTMAVSTLVAIIKRNSTIWVRDSFDGVRDFAWQSGYAVFSVDKRNDAALRRYIQGQDEHHRIRPYETEYLRMLRAFDHTYDENYVFD
jgi:putative transposase